MKLLRLLILTLGLAASTGQGGETPDWKRIAPDYPFEFPRDHGSHPDYRTEWWYFTGNVKTESGREFGYQLTFFRHGIDPAPPAPEASRLRPRQVIFAHLAVADLQTGAFHPVERIRRMDGLMTGTSETDMDVFLEDWTLRRSEGDALAFRARDSEAGVGLSFRLRPVKPLVFQGIDGFSKKGAEEGNASSYLSWTRLHTEGDLTLGSETFSVRGESWFDHEWGTSQLGEGVVGWDWFGLRLDDHRELMIYRLRNRDGSPSEYSAGTVVEKDGRSRHLSHRDFTIESLSTWTSPKTGAVYPAGWTVRIPSAEVEMEVRPLIDDAELATRESIGTVYWEGPVSITGNVTGRGYAELTGYADRLDRRF